MSHSDSKRIAKNTLFLYIRMFLTILCNLYIVRVVWDILGIDNYGIYNVIGGVVAMFAFLKSAMVATSQRFTSYELGKGIDGDLRKVFSVSIKVHLILAFIILILTETIGLWFINSKVNIPNGRIIAANWVYQCSIATLLISIISIPYDACIVAHEHMKIYGYFGVFEVLLKLILVLILTIIPGDKLVIYSMLMLGVSIIMRILSQLYCRKQFEETRNICKSEKSLVSKMFSFSGWSFLGNLGFSLRDQGLNIILNLFFNVSLNAAKGIANQIGGVVYGFGYNFQMAINPQITKKYASRQTEEMMNLIFKGCKFSSFLMMIVVIPLFMSCELFLKIWIENVAEYTSGFIRLILITIIIDSLVGPITTGIQATGKIRNFQIAIFIITLINLPLAWVWLKFDLNPYIVCYASIITSTIALLVRLKILHQLIKFPYKKFFQLTVFKVFVVLVVSFIPCYYSYQYIPKTILGLIVYCVITTIIIGSFIFILGLTQNERRLSIEILRNRIRAFSNKN